MSRIKLLLDVIEDMRSLADSLQAVADAMTQGDAPVENAKAVTPTAASAPTEPPVEKPIPFEEVRAFLGQKSRKGYTAEIRELLQKYGADKLSAVDPRHYAALMKDAEVLGDAP